MCFWTAFRVNRCPWTYSRARRSPRSSSRWRCRAGSSARSGSSWPPTAIARVHVPDRSFRLSDVGPEALLLPAAVLWLELGQDTVNDRHHHGGASRGGLRFRRVGTPLLKRELDRARRAARIRQMPVTEFLRQAVILVSDDTLARGRHDLAPFGRRDVESYRVR